MSSTRKNPLSKRGGFYRLKYTTPKHPDLGKVLYDSIASFWKKECHEKQISLDHVTRNFHIYITDQVSCLPPLNHVNLPCTLYHSHDDRSNEISISWVFCCMSLSNPKYEEFCLLGMLLSSDAHHTFERGASEAFLSYGLLRTSVTETIHAYQVVLEHPLSISQNSCSSLSILEHSQPMELLPIYIYVPSENDCQRFQDLDVDMSDLYQCTWSLFVILKRLSYQICHVQECAMSESSEKELFSIIRNFYYDSIFFDPRYASSIVNSASALACLNVILKKTGDQAQQWLVQTYAKLVEVVLVDPSYGKDYWHYVIKTVLLEHVSVDHVAQVAASRISALMDARAGPILQEIMQYTEGFEKNYRDFRERLEIYSNQMRAEAQMKQTVQNEVDIEIGDEQIDPELEDLIYRVNLFNHKNKLCAQHGAKTK